jgi:hypothetical protein
MVLTLVGVTPGGFNADSDCKVVVNSSSAAMITSTRCQTRNEKKESPAIGDTAQATRLCGENPRQHTRTVLELARQWPKERSRLYEKCGMPAQLMEDVCAKCRCSETRRNVPSL